MAMKNSGSECEPTDYGAFTVVCILCTLEDKLWPLGVDCNTTFQKSFLSSLLMMPFLKCLHIISSMHYFMSLSLKSLTVLSRIS